MKNSIVLNWDELSDSKEAYSERPNPFVTWTICLLALLFAVGIIYCAVGKIEITATAQGIVRPNEDISTVSSLVSGKIKEMHYEDSSEVCEGESLIVLENDELLKGKNSLVEKEENIKEQNKLLDKFLDGIADSTNPFSSKPKSAEYSYYLRFREYELARESSDKKVQYEKNSINLNISELNNQILSMTQAIEGLENYKKSVDAGKDLTYGDPKYSAMYHQYESTLNTLQTEYEQKIKSNNDSSVSVDALVASYENDISVYRNLVKSLETGIDVFGETISTGKLLYDVYCAEIESCDSETADKIKNLTITLAKALIDQKTQELSEVESAYEGESKISTDKLLKDTYENNKKNAYYQVITQIDDAIETMQGDLRTTKTNLKKQELEKILEETDGDVSTETSIAIIEEKEQNEALIDEIEAELLSIEKQIEQSYIIAQSDGIINEIKDLTKGDLVNAGEVIATIIPKNENRYKVVLYIGNKDIGKIHIGDTIKYTFDSLPKNQYGIIEGEVTHISEDAQLIDGQFTDMFEVEGSINQNNLIDHENNVVRIDIGMQTEAKIVVERKTILRYLQGLIR